MTNDLSLTALLPDAPVEFRPIAPGDMPFLMQLYGSTRADELALVDWADTQKQAFIAMQFEAQHAYYQQHYTQAYFELVLLQGDPIGRLYLNPSATDIRIVDIALLPEFRGRGLGTALLRSVLALGQRTGAAVSIHVEQFNPALRLYKRLGFGQVGEVGVYFLMRWTPDSQMRFQGDDGAG